MADIMRVCKECEHYLHNVQHFHPPHLILHTWPGIHTFGQSKYFIYYSCSYVIAFDVMCDVNLGNQTRSQLEAEFAVIKLNFNLRVQPQGA